jgi:hypothetical protein
VNKKYFLALILSFLLAVSSVIVFTTETTSEQQIAIAQAPPFIQTQNQEEVIIEMPNISPTVLSTNAAMTFEVSQQISENVNADKPPEWIANHQPRLNPGSYIITFNENATKQDVGFFEAENIKAQKISDNVKDISNRVKQTSDRISQERGKVPFVYDHTGYGMNIQNVKSDEILRIAAQHKDVILDIHADKLVPQVLQVI